MVIAIDGPGGVGKSTVSKAVAEALGLAYLDTGSTYRAATVITLDEQVDTGDEAGILDALSRHSIDYDECGIVLDGRPIADRARSEEVTGAVSAVSAHPQVRQAIVELQRAWVAQHGGRAVVEGRDIGTVVFPQAPVKVFLTARPEVRASRRAGDAEAAHQTMTQIQEALTARDTADASRASSPMQAADDAVVIDTSDLGIDAVVERITDLAASAGRPI